jgi:hypothetical protein
MSIARVYLYEGERRCSILDAVGIISYNDRDETASRNSRAGESIRRGLQENSLIQKLECIVPTFHTAERDLEQIKQSGSRREHTREVVRRVSECDRVMLWCGTTTLVHRTFLGLNEVSSL